MAQLRGGAVTDKTDARARRLKLKAQLLVGDEIAFGPGKADLLDAIRTCGSSASTTNRSREACA